MSVFRARYSLLSYVKRQLNSLICDSPNSGHPGQNLVWRFTTFEFPKKRYICPCSDWWTIVNDSEVGSFRSMVFKSWHRNLNFALTWKWLHDVCSHFGINCIRAYGDSVSAQLFINWLSCNLNVNITFHAYNLNFHYVSGYLCTLSNLLLTSLLLCTLHVCVWYIPGVTKICIL